MDTTEKMFLEKAKNKGLSFLEISKNKITFAFMDTYAKITKNRPSKEFEDAMVAVYER